MNKYLPAAAIFIILLSVLAFAQNRGNAASAASAGDTVRRDFLPVSEVREGMTGKAKTVFSGHEPEEFDVEILGVLPGWIGPNQDLIIGRISGGGADRTQVFAGMSGSPVYIGERLVGAISYAFPFSKEAICGITPIDQMITIFEKNNERAPSATTPRSYSFAELAATEWKPGLPPLSPLSGSGFYPADASSPLGVVSGQTFRPISIPVSFSGLSQATLNEFSPQLLRAGLMPVSAPVGAAPSGPMKKADADTLVGGDSVAMHLTRGDISMAAAGTVTFRDGEKIYAFGHPFLSLGSSSLPMSESHVVTVVPSLNNSFKLAVPDAMVGSMVQDRATGVFGKLGEAPEMIPVRIRLKTSRNQLEEIDFEIAHDEILSPLLLNMAVFNAITATERSLGDLTIEVSGRVEVAGHSPITIDRRYAGQAATRFAAGALVVPVGNLLVSRFDGLKIEGITVDLVANDGSRVASLERIEVDRSEARAGETIFIQAFVRSDSGKVFTQRIPFTIPADTPTGGLTIEVGDGGALQQKAAAQEFVPKTLAELIRTINDVKKNDRLYVQSYRVTKGAIIGANEMPNLPPSVLATLNNGRTAGGFKPTVQTVVSEIEIAPAEFVVSGQQSINIEIVK